MDAGHPSFRLQPAAAELVRRHRALVARHHDVGDAVALEVGHHRRRVDPALARLPLAEQAAPRVEHERRVEGRDDLQPSVSVEVDQARGGEPPRLTGVDVADELRVPHRCAATLVDARCCSVPLARLRADGSGCAGHEPGSDDHSEACGNAVHLLHPQEPPDCGRWRLRGGRSRDRTCDHLLVRQALYR